MSHFTGFLLGKVQLDGAIRSEILGSLVETLVQKYHPADIRKKNGKFSEANMYTVEVSDRGLRLTSPGMKSSSDEGFESDCESVRSVKVNAVELDLSVLIDDLDISKEEKEIDGEAQGFSLTPPATDSLSISSSTGLRVASDDNNSSSGNGSDSDEFCVPGERSPYWEPLSNSSSFQSYPIEDVVFCHCDPVHSSTLVWVLRHLSKMVALVIHFRTRVEAESLFTTYRNLRLTLKPVKFKMNPILGRTATEEPFGSLRSTVEGRGRMSHHPKSLDFFSIPPPVDREVYDGRKEEEESEEESEEDESTVQDVRPSPTRKYKPPKRPVLLVPLKTENVGKGKNSYPKESYLYHVMGRTTSTFAPYQRSMNFLAPYPGGSSGMVGFSNGRLLVPFSSWLELSEAQQGTKSLSTIGKSRFRGGGRTPAFGSKGTAKILLRDSGRQDGMWATLSQRFKRNFRNNVVPKLNGMWGPGSENGRKRKSSKKVTFNAWATVQMV